MNSIPISCLEVPELIESHFQHLHQGSGISIDVISERGYRSALNPKMLAEAGFSKSQCRPPGILIPLWGVDGEKTGYTYRPDNPRMNRKDKPLKYENPKGSSLRLDCPPRCQIMLGDPSVDLYITEGVKKGDALASQGVSALVLSGVWGFKAKNQRSGVTLLVDWDHIALNGRKVYVVFDSDVISKSSVHQALQRLTEHLRRRKAEVFHIFLPPNNYGKTGVDDYLLEHSVEDLNQLAIKALELTDSIDNTLATIFSNIEAGQAEPKQVVLMLRGLKGTPPHLRRSYISAAVIAILRKLGGFIRNSTGRFYFHIPTKQLLELDSFEFGVMLSDTFGLNQIEPEFRYTMADLNTEAHVRGQQTQVHRFSFYDRNDNILYVDRFNGSIYRLDGKKIELVDNGTGDILFSNQPTWEPYKYISTSSADGLLSEMLIDDIPFQNDSFAPLTSNEQRMVFYLWILSLFFESLLPTKPILAIIGEKGSSKTTTLRRVLRLLFGRRADVIGLERDKEDAFVAAITHSHLAVFDNLDGKIKWINDRLALAASSSVIERRRLYTTNEVAIYEPKCFLALTSRNPQFRRDDVVDRLILLKVERLLHFRPESEIMDVVDSQRNLIWSELLNDLNSIVASLTDMTGRPETNFRMSDWANLCWHIARIQEVDDSFDIILHKLSIEQANFALEDDPLYLCLGVWLQDTDNLGKEVDASTLYKELSKIAEFDHIEWSYKSTMSFAKRLNNIGSNLKQLVGFEIRKDNRERNFYSFGLRDLRVNDGVTK